jgi:hypothetical protein
VPHTFRVRAVNAAGAGPWSEAKEAKRHTGVGPLVERARHVVSNVPIVINGDRCVRTRVRLVVSFQMGSQVARVRVWVYFHEPYVVRAWCLCSRG